MNRTTKWLAALVFAVMMTPAAGDAQVRSRSRVPIVPEAPLVNLYWQQESRTRLGLYLDVYQSRRYDGDGALVTRVMRDSPAEEAGLEDGDIIIAFEGQVLTSPLPDDDLEEDFDVDESLPVQRLLALAEDLEIGQVVEIRYLRDGASNTVSVETDEFEFPDVRTFGANLGVVFGRGRDGDASGVFLRNRDALTLQLRGLETRLEGLTRLEDFDLDRLEGLTVGLPGVFGGFGVASTEGVRFIDLHPELGDYFGSEDGVLVVEVDEDSTLGLMAGDVVLAVGSREAETVGRVMRLIRSYDEDEPIRFRIMRQGGEMVAEGVRR